MSLVSKRGEGTSPLSLEETDLCTERGNLEIEVVAEHLRDTDARLSRQCLQASEEWQEVFIDFFDLPPMAPACRWLRGRRRLSNFSAELAVSIDNMFYHE